MLLKLVNAKLHRLSDKIICQKKPANLIYYISLLTYSLLDIHNK